MQINKDIRFTKDENSPLLKSRHLSWKGKYGDIPAIKKTVGAVDRINVDKICAKISEFVENISHRNVAAYFDIEITQDFVYVFQELCEKSLGTWVEEQKLAGSDTTDQVIDILKQATTGLKYLHDSKVLNIYPNPENIFVIEGCKNIQVKIADFGLPPSEMVSSNSGKFIDPFIWLPPEANEIQGQDFDVTPQMDMFALGCVFYYLITIGCHPFGDRGHATSNILNGEYKLNLTDINPSLLPHLLLIQAMTSMDPKQRPFCDVVLSHPFFWTQRETWDFFMKMSVISREDTKRFKKSMEQLEASKLLVLADKGIRWIESVCPQMQSYLQSLPSVVGRGDTMESLFHTVAFCIEKFDELPSEIQTVLGGSCTQSLSYWNARFPFFINVLWLSSRNARKNVLAKDFYKFKSPLHLGNDTTLLLQYFEAFPNYKPPKLNLDIKQAEKKNVGDLVRNQLNDYEPIKCLGSGGFGVVFEAKYKIDGIKYAIKAVPIPNISDGEKRALKEVKVLADLFHTNIVRYHHSWIEKLPQGCKGCNNSLWEEHWKQLLVTPSYLLTKQELCKHGTLCDWLSEKREPNLLERVKLFVQIVNAVQYIHTDKHLIHRDLKPGNVFLTTGKSDELVAKVGDFGLTSTKFAGDLSSNDEISQTAAKELTRGVGTRLYMAPEMEGKSYTNKVDIFSLGIIFVEILVEFGEKFKERDSYVKEYIKKGVLKDDFVKNFPELYILTKGMVSTDPDLRPDIGKVKHEVEKYIKRKENQRK